MAWPTVIGLADLVIRGIALTALVLAGAVAGTHWAVRHRRINPFGWLARTVRRLSDPMLRPIERRLLQSGKNPQDGSLWLFGIAVVAGIALVAAFRSVVGLVVRITYLVAAGPAAWLPAIVDGIISVLILALFVRVVTSWFGVSSRARWLRPFVWATEWLLGPIRRRLPALGMMDLSPIVAYLILMALQVFLVPLL